MLSGLKSQLNDHMTSLPVLSEVENFGFKNFYCTKRFAVKFQGGGFRGVFRTFFDLRHHLVVYILNFESFVTRVTDMNATVNKIYVAILIKNIIPIS